MAFTEDEEKKLRELLNGGERVSDLPVATGAIDQMNIEVLDTTDGTSKQMNLHQAVITGTTPYGGRYWNETLSTPTATGYCGSLDFLRKLPETLGLGCYLVQDDRTRRKLDPTNHYKFADGSAAKLDGSMGQYMFCWNAHYYGWWKEGNNFYEAVSLSPIKGAECYYIPAGGWSALCAGVVDRTDLKLCSIINDDPRYRGGSNNAAYDGTYRTFLGKPTSGIALQTFSAYARKRGQGWEAGWYFQRAVIEYLFRIIMGTRHCQAAYNASKDANGLYQGGLGAGFSNWTTALWTDYNGRYPSLPCSAGVELGDGVGIASYDILKEDGSVAITANIPVFFGLKNLWGNLWQGIRGLINDIQATNSFSYVAKSMYEEQSNTSVENMLRAGQFAEGTNEGYIKKLSMHRLCGTPTEIGGSSTNYYGDYLWRGAANLGLRCRLAGGSADYGAYAGAVAINVYYAVTYSGSTTTCPLCYSEEDCSPVPITG